MKAILEKPTSQKMGEFFHELPQSEKTVSVMSLFEDKERKSVRNVAAAIAVSFGGKSAFVTLNAEVPEGSEIVRSASDAVLGLPAVAGG